MKDLLKKAHALWREGRELEALTYLREAVDWCRTFHLIDRLIEVLNEYGGALRVVGKYEEGIEALEEAKMLCETNYLNTESYATTLMNLGNIYREKKDFEKAEHLFSIAREEFLKLGLKGYSYIGLLNNYAILMRQIGNYEKANKMQLEAISLLEKEEKYRIPLAISFNNLYDIQKKLGLHKDAEEYLRKAEEIIKNNLGEKHPLYAAVLNNLADFQYSIGHIKEALDFYEKALVIVEKTYGRESSAYKSVQNNIEHIKKRQSSFSESMKKGDGYGIKLAKELSQRVISYIQNNYPMIYEELCIGLVGKGSECYGFDDEYSRDHDFETRCMIFLKKDTYRKIATFLREDFSREFSERIEIYSIEGFYKFYTSFDRGPETIEEFRRVSEEFLSTATNGEVFLDKAGEFSAIRNRLLKHYPKDLFYKFMAYHLNYMAQAGQYNVPRLLKRGDIVAADLAVSEFVKHYIFFVHLINKKYTPFYKWSYKSCEYLEVMGEETRDQLEQLSIADRWEKADVIESICKKIVEYLQKTGLSKSNADFLSYQAKEVEKWITDCNLKKIDSWVR